MKKIILSFLIAILILFNSCLGAQADITIRADGSGKVALEYRVSQMLESIGRLDGNERWPAIPVGKADFERSMARIPGLKLKSFSSKDAPGSAGGRDLVTKVELEFSNAEALTSFLDSSGSKASLTRNNGKNLLRLVLLEPSVNFRNEELNSLLKEVSAGYEISISLSAPKNANLTVSPLSVLTHNTVRIVNRGKKVSFTMNTGELLGLKDGLVLEMEW